MKSQAPRIGFIGFGEVAYGMALGFDEAGLKQKVAYVSGKRNRPPYSEAFRKRAKSAGVELVSTLEEVARKSDIIFSCVTGDVNLEVAKQVAPFLGPRKMYIDVNNSPPQAKELAAQAVNKLGASFVDVAIVGQPRVKKHQVPMWVSGDGAEDFKAMMDKYGMDIKIIPGRAGTAAMLKTIWQVFTKGLQGLLWETLLAARRAGVDLKAHPHPPVIAGGETIHFEIPDTLVCHAGIHAARKAAELKESAEVIRQLGIEPIVTEAAVKRLEKLARFNLKERFNGEIPAEGYQAMLKAIEETGEDVS